LRWLPWQQQRGACRKSDLLLVALRVTFASGFIWLVSTYDCQTSPKDLLPTPDLITLKTGGKPGLLPSARQRCCPPTPPVPEGCSWL
jgi:hypothetical protein